MSEEATYAAVWPLGPSVPELEAFTPRPADLGGLVIAELWDWLYSGDRAYALLRDELRRRHPGVSFVDYDVFGNVMQGPQVTERLAALLAEHGVDVAIAAVGHCGSCTPAVVRSALAAEHAGVPTVSIVGSHFEALAIATARASGVAGLPLAVYPGRIPDDSPDVFDEKIRTTVLDQVVAGLTGASPGVVAPDSEPALRDVVVSGTLDEVQEAFHDNGWTEGLPIVPPTVERVESFLAHTDRSPDESLGVAKPARRQATVWSVAANGVMAGCRPEHMPVLIALVEAIVDPAFRLETAGAGVGWEPLVVVSGPIAAGFNAGTGALRAGHRANTSIGRFLRLYTRNVAGVRPGETDRGGIGSNFRVVLAEDERTIAQLGWPTFGEDCGVPRSESAVTVHSVIAESPQFGEYGCSPDNPASYLEPIAEVFGQGICGYWLFLSLAYGHCDPVVILSPYVARVLHAAGWDKDDVRTFLDARATVRARSVQARGAYVNLDIPAQVAAGALPARYHESDDADREVSAFLAPEAIRIVVAGNPDMYYQQGFMSYPAQGAPVTKTVNAEHKGDG